MGLPWAYKAALCCKSSLEKELVLVEDLPLERCYRIVISCIEALENEQKPINDAKIGTDVSKWNSLFGEKETTITVLAKLVAMQKTLLDLMERTGAQEEAGHDMSEFTQEDWQLLALCVDRWRARGQAGKASNSDDNGA